MKTTISPLSLFSLSILASLISRVAAHGFVSEMTINNKSYTGPKTVENADGVTIKSIVRQIDTTSPVKDLTSADMACGRGAAKRFASDSAPVSAGSVITLKWDAGDGTNWIHEIGPLMNYMAQCDGPCSSFDATKAKWFKIQQDGQKPGLASWYQKDLTVGKAYSLTIPKGIANGEYLLRHEIIALHTATSVGGAEFYPSCSQLTVTGGGSGVAAAKDTATFPGNAYSATDPGILVPNVFNPGFDYSKDFPGPALVSFTAGGGVSGGNSTTATTSPVGNSGAGVLTTKILSTTADAETATYTSSPSVSVSVYPNPSATYSHTKMQTVTRSTAVASRTTRFAETTFVTSPLSSSAAAVTSSVIGGGAVGGGGGRVVVVTMTITLPPDSEPTTTLVSGAATQTLDARANVGLGVPKRHIHRSAHKLRV